MSRASKPLGMKPALTERSMTGCISDGTIAVPPCGQIMLAIDAGVALTRSAIWAEISPWCALVYAADASITLAMRLTVSRLAVAQSREAMIAENHQRGAISFSTG